LSAIKIHEILRKQQFVRKQIWSKSLAQTLRSLHFLGYVLQIYIPHVRFLKKMPAGKIFGEIAAKIAQKSNTKNKIFGGKCCENRTF
jgi:hypothetical protein